MLKPERVTFSADDDQFHPFTTSDQLDSFLNDSLVHYSTDFKRINPQEVTSIRNSNSFDELSSITMSSQDQQQPQTEHEPPASAPPALLSEEVPILNDNNLHQFDALTLQQLAVGSNQTLSNNNEEKTKTSPSHSTSLADIQKEIDRVKQMKYGRTYSSPTSSICSRLTNNPFNGANNNIDLSSITHSVHFTDQANSTNRLPFSSTFITSIPESIVPASGTSSTNDNHFIPIHHIESPSIEDREVFETFHTKQTSVPGVAIRQSTKSLNRNISTSETDLLASLHRSASKQALDNQSDHGTTYSGTSDDMIFVEWDKERSLFQDYINSLRTEIRVLLQERSEYQKQMEAINSNLGEHQRWNSVQTNMDQTKLDLLQKSLEEKNLVLEQLQKEYETMKEKNTNLTRKVSNLRCDAKAQTGVIDELKQKIAELTVDIQNHVLVKRRLEISMMNLESDCKIIDAERLRLNHDLKDTHLNKQDLEKLLQQANVQIAEQGSTIEMLRSDNIQIRSQLSATQRRMLQEKQQVMDYLRQIENDLVEKEQIKQRESFLRKDYEKLQSIHQQDRQEIDQLNLQINQDKQKLTQLEQERLQLLKTIQNVDDKQRQVESDLDLYKSATKRLYTHFKIPFDSIQSIDQLIPMLEDRYRTEQISHARIHQIPLAQSAPQVNNEQNTEEIRRLQEDLVSKDIQLKQLDEANQAWQQYQQNQLVLLRDRLKINEIDNLSFEDIVQQVENRLNDQLMELQDLKKADADVNRLQQSANTLQEVGTQRITDNTRQSKDTQTEDNEEYQRQQDHKPEEIPIQNVALENNQYEEELRQLREDLDTVTAQCAQLDEANRAWQLYHQTQLDSFRDKLQNSFPTENEFSLDDIAQHIIAHLDHLRDERESLMQQLQTSEKLNNDLHSESVNNNQTVQQTYVDAISALNEELRLLKQQNDQLETEKYILNQQLEKQSSVKANQERNTPTPDSTTSDSKLVKKHVHSTSIHEAQIHNISPVQSASPLINEHEQELQQLRQNITLLTNQCAQLDEANRAWQLYQQSQLDNFRNTIQQHLPIDDNPSLEQAAQQIVDQINKERHDFTQQYLALENVNDELRSESVNNMETIDELNQELLAIKEKNQQPNDATSSNLLARPFDEIPTSTSESAEQEESGQLREDLISLTAQLDETNRAWKEYQETQVDILRNQLENCLSIDYDGSFEKIGHQIVNQVTREREDAREKYQALERANHDLQTESSDNLESIRQSLVNTVNELNQELLVMKEAYEQLGNEKQVLASELEKRPLIADSEEVRQLRENVVALTTQCAQLDEANRAWQLYQQTQLDNFQTKLHDYFSIDDIPSLNEIAQQIINQVTSEREDSREKYQALEKANNDLPSHGDLQSIRQSYVNTVNELNQELLTMNEAYKQLDAEKQGLLSELEKRSVEVDRIQNQRTTEKISSDIWKEPFRAVPIHTTGPTIDQETEEVQRLRENVAALTAQCAQLNEANRAWQLYQQAQLDNFRAKLHDYVTVDDNASLDSIAQQIVDQVTGERADSHKKYQALERVNQDLPSHDDLESIRQSHMNTLNGLNQELLTMKEAYDQLSVVNQVLASELEKRSLEVDQNEVPRTAEKVSSGIWKQPFKEVPIHTSSADVEQETEGEVQQLRDNVAVLTARCAQLDEANRAWQLYQQTQLDNFKTKLHDYLTVDENASLDNIGQQIVDQMTKEREDFVERYAELEKLENDFASHGDLESMRQAHVNTVNALNQELLAMKDAYDQLDIEKENLVSELEKRSAEIDRIQSQRSTEKVSSAIWKEPFREVPIHTSSAGVEQETEGEVQQLRENVAVLTARCAELDEANRAWQLYQQAQLNNFRAKLHDYVTVDDNSPLDHIGQQIVDEMTKEREDSTKRCAELEKLNDDLRLELTTDLETIKESYLNTVNELNQEILALKEAYEQLATENQVMADELQKQPIVSEFSPVNLIDEVPLQTSNANVEEANEELREKFAVLTSQYAQLNEANQAWQTFHQSQLNNFRTKIQDCIQIDDDFSFDQIAQQIVDQITKDQEDFTEQYQALEKINANLQSESIEINKQLLLIKEQYEEVLQEKTMLTNRIENQERDKQTIDSTQQLVFLQNQCTHLENVNRSWQTFYDNQIDLLKEKFQDYIQSNDNLDFEQIIQLIVAQLDSNETDQLKQQITEFQETNNLLMNTNQNLTSRLNQFERPSSPLVSQENFKQIRRTPIQEVQIHRLTPVQSVGDEELQQLRTNLSALTAQCAQLDEANRAWQQYHQNQLEIFRKKLQDWILFDENSTLEQIGPAIIVQLDQLGNNKQLDLDGTIESLNRQLGNYQSNESILAQNLEQLNQKLLDIHHECEEFREHNARLILSNQQMKLQLEECQQQIDKLQAENQQAQIKFNDLEQRPSSLVFQRVESPRQNVAIHNIDQDREDEIRQIRNDLAAASAHCLQLDEANRAWQKYQYDQIEAFRQNLQTQIPSFNQIENPSLDFIAQQILNHLDQLNSQRDSLIHQNDSLKDEIQLHKKELERPSSADGGKRMFRRLSQEKHIREAQIHNISPVQSASPLINEHEQELQQLRENITLLTNQCAQLDEANRAWQLYQQSQLDNFRNTVQQHLPIDDNPSLEQAAQQIVDQINKERHDFTQQYLALEKVNEELRSESENNMETIDQLNQELLAIKENSQQTNDATSSNLLARTFDEIPTSTSESAEQEESGQLREDLVSLTAQLDETNRAWKEYQETQVDILRNQLENCLSIDYDSSFEKIGQQIVNQVTREREDAREKYQALERANQDLPSHDDLESIQQSHMNTLNGLNQELLTMKEAYDQLNVVNQVLASELEKRSLEVDQNEVPRTAEKVSSSIWKQPFKEVPIHTSSADVEQETEEEVQQLRDNVAVLTARCAQLDEANRAWQLYQQTQLDNFRTKLHDYLTVDENASFDDIAQQIVDQMTKELEDFTERYAELEKLNDDLRTEMANNIQRPEQPSTETVDELNEELLNLRNQYDELEKMNKQLLFEKEDLNNRLNDRSIVVGHHSAFESNIVEEESPLETKEESSTIPADLEEIHQLRSDFALITSQLTELTQTNENELNSFRNKLQNWIPLPPNSTLDEIAQQLNIQFEEQIPPEATEKEIQTIPPPDKVHIAIETTPLTYENHHTQIDPIDMIDEQIQTESLLHIWSMNNDDNLLNANDDDDRLQEYIDEITSLSSLDLSYRLNKECEQILFKQNFNKTSYPNLDLNHLALITIYSLYQQHLTDDAKQLYNDTVIRALKQEYELINNEKNDYMDKYLQEIDSTEKKFHQIQTQYDDLLEQNELERLDSKQSMIDLKEKYDFNLYNLHQENEQLKSNFHIFEENSRQIKGENLQQLENEYQKLREDYNELINQNELLKDYNSQIYQIKLQDQDSTTTQSVYIQTESDFSPPEIPIDEPNLSSIVNETQTIQDRIHQAIIDRPEWFPDVSDDAIERLDQLISTMENQIDSLNTERENLLERNHQLEKDIQLHIDRSFNQRMNDEESTQTDFYPEEQSSPIENDEESTKKTIDNQTQTEEPTQDKLIQINNKFKRALQNIKDKIHQVVVERSELFTDVGEETIERLDHLISTVGNQATQIDLLQNQLRSALESSQYQIDNERDIKMEQLVSAAPSTNEISPSIIEDYEKQVQHLEEKLSQNENERTLLRERLNEVELEFQKTSDDHASMIAMYDEQLQSLVQERNVLVEEQALRSADSQHDNEELAADLKQTPVTSNEDIQSLQEIIRQQAEEMRDLSEKYFASVARVDAQDEFEQQKRENQERLNTYENQIEHLIREHANLLDQVQNKSVSIDNESQTEDQQHDKLAQMNTKLKRALQIFKEKIHRIATERSDLFVNIGEETSERLDHLISTVEHQATQLDLLQVERSEIEEQLRNEIQELQSSLEASQYQTDNEQPVTAAPPTEDYEKQINQLQQKLSQNEDERSLLRERLNEVELEFRKTFDDRASTTAMHEEQLQSLVQERNALIEQQTIQSAESQQEIEELQQQLDELKQSLANQPVDTSANEEIQLLKDEIQETSEELKDLSEKYLTLSSQLDSYVDLQTEFDRQKREAEERLADYQNQIENLTLERTNLLEEIQKNTSSSSIQTTDDQQHDKLAKINTKLKRVLQTFKEKIHRIVTERPDLFNNIGEETSERLDHLISTVEQQAIQLDLLQAEHSEVEEQLRNEIRELQDSVEAYRYQIENERPVKTEQLVTAAPPIEDYEKQINQLQRKLSQNEDERSLLRERLNEVELEFRKTFDDRASTKAIYEEQLQSLVQERNALIEQQTIQSAESQQEIERLQEEIIQLKQSDRDINSLNEIIDQQSEQLRQINEKYIAVSSQLQSQTDYQNQIENLTRERANLLEEIQKNASSSIPTVDDQQQDKLAKINIKLKRALQTFKEKIHRIVLERPDLFADTGEETSERLDHLISTVEQQATRIHLLQAERSEIEEQLRNEINDLQNSFDLYRKQIDEDNRLKSQLSPSALIHQTETESKYEIQPLQASNDNQWNDWSNDSSQQLETQLQYSTDEQEPSVANRLFGFFKTVASPWTDETSTNDWNEQSSPLHLPSDEPQQTVSSSSSIDHLISLIKNKIHQFTSEYPNLFPNPNENILDNLDQFTSIIKHLQDQIQELQNKSILHEHLDIPPTKESSISIDQGISRRVFEQEMLAWSKESERLKQFVKQIQIENKKLKDIILKFEPIIHDYMHENERLKQENQQFSFLSYPSDADNSISSDTDICYLTLKWLTYEVAQRTSNTNEQSVLMTDENESYLSQRLIETERQLKSIRIQNQKLKKQLETHTIQFKHIQHEINTKNQELATLKIEIDRLRHSETQYRLEVDRLKVDLQCDQVKFQQLEREVTDLKLEQTPADDTNNLRELLELKERELNALKEKLDYTLQAHQLELQEAIKANQFSLDNVQRFEQLDQRHQEKRKELERRLGKICKMVRPLIDNQYLFREESIINIDELQQLITDTEAEERVINSLGPIRDVLGLLESQMKELHHNLIENHARRSKKSRYRLGFESSPDENHWESTDHLSNYQEASENSDLFLDLIEHDVRLCLDDLIDEVIVRTTVN